MLERFRREARAASARNRAYLAARYTQYLPGNKRGGRGPEKVAPSNLETGGFWEDRIRPPLERYSLALAFLFLVIASVRIVSTYSQLSVVDDEPGHFACGLEWLSKQVPLRSLTTARVGA